MASRAESGHPAALLRFQGWAKPASRQLLSAWRPRRRGMPRPRRGAWRAAGLAPQRPVRDGFRRAVPGGGAVIEGASGRCRMAGSGVSNRGRARGSTGSRTGQRRCRRRVAAGTRRAKNAAAGLQPPSPLRSASPHKAADRGGGFRSGTRCLRRTTGPCRLAGSDGSNPGRARGAAGAARMQAARTRQAKAATGFQPTDGGRLGLSGQSPRTGQRMAATAGEPGIRPE